MNYMIRLLFVASVILSVSTAWGQKYPSAAPLLEQYLNFAHNATGDALYLEQSDNACETDEPVEMDGIPLICINSVRTDNDARSIAQILEIMLNGSADAPGGYWKNSLDVSKNQYTDLVLASDLDFKEIYNSTEGACSVEHTPLTFGGKNFNGGGHAVKNLCYVQKSNGSKPIGLFESFGNGNVQGAVNDLQGIVKNLQIFNVYFAVADNWINAKSGKQDTTPSKNGAHYYPMGALAGKIFRYAVENVSLTNVTLSSPFAGGVAGYIDSSKVSKIYAIGDAAEPLKVNNKIQLARNADVVESNNFIGSSIGENVTADYKVILGGVAAISKYSTFEKIDISLSIENEAKADSSAIGGVAGYYIYGNPQEIKPYSNSDIKVSVLGKIDGATSIGGVFGETKRMAMDSYHKSTLFLNDVNVINLVATTTNVVGEKPIGVYWGGVIGKSCLCNGGSLKIARTKATVDFNYMQTEDATYKNYMGGLVGYASCSNSNNFSGDDLSLNLTNSKAAGSIKLLGNSALTNGKVHASTTIGGLVGEALLAVEENTVAVDTAEVDIQYSVKNAVDLKAKKASEKLHVGGIFGAASIFNTSGKAVNMSGLIYKGNINVNDDGLESFVGGIIGKYPMIDNYGNSHIAFSDVHVQAGPASNDELLQYFVTREPGYTSSAYLGGVCGDCKAILTMSKVSVVGNIENSILTAGIPNKNYSVGGLVGQSNLISSPITVKNTYSVGSITKGFSKNASVGYLFGTLTGNNGRKSKFISNYHYSENAEPVAAIGNGDGKMYDDFRVPYSSSVAKNNIFNCPQDADESILTDQGNGCMVSRDMRTKDFGERLNEPWEDVEDKVWNFNETAAAASLPTFSESPYSFPESSSSATSSSSEGSSSSANETSSSSIASSSSNNVSSSSGNVESSSSKDNASSSVNKASSSSTNGATSSSSESEASSSSENDTSSSSKKNSSSSSWSETTGSSSSSSEEFGKSSSSANNGKSSSSNEESSSSNVSSSSINGKLSSSSVKNDSSSSNSDKSSSSVASSSSKNDTSSSSKKNSSSSSENGVSSSSKKDSSSSSRSDSSSSSWSKAAESSSSSSENSGKSSSSSNGKSSSSGKDGSGSYKYIYEIAEPTATQDGNALRMEFDNKLASTSEKVDYHIKVVSDVGVYLDTVVDAKSVESVKNGLWRLDPAPVGEYTVTFTLTDGDDSISYDKKFITEKQKTYTPRAWQTLSLNAFCYNKGDGCLSDLETRLGLTQSDWAKEECKYMQDEVKRGMNDAQFYQRMKNVCAQASGSGAVTSVYWWDESNPVGEFWQYRKFSVKDKFDSTRGYWYGPVNHEPFAMSLQTPNMNDAIEWHLENKYSGWNLVANPYGWYVKLPKDENINFCQWDPDSSGYVEPDVLGPYEALWVHTEKTMTYRIPLKAAIVLENEKKSLNKSAESENWNLRVVLSDNNGKRDSWNEIAVGRTAKTLGEPPAGMGDRVNLSIVEGKKRLAKSVKKNADDLEWDLEVSATTSRDGKLSFEGLESVWEKGMRVYATVDNETVEVVKDSPVDVKLSSNAKNVSVRVTKNAVVANVAKNLLKGLRVNQAPNVLNVGFDAASRLAGTNVKVSVVGIDGRIVASGKSIANAGTNAISMKKPKQGVYFVKVKVGSLSAVTRVMVR